ncbi:hypothetical protein BD779DRAFT_1787154 [Infundibulicybe gibba]|nr:hypothetical protein BD779DRAFT_1787154 [Infundibulicybe gibba]
MSLISDPNTLPHSLHCSLGDGPATCKFPVERKLGIEGCATNGELANPEEFDAKGRRCYIVGKDVGIEAVELGSTTGAQECRSLQRQGRFGLPSLALGEEWQSSHH